MKLTALKNMKLSATAAGSESPSWTGFRSPAMAATSASRAAILKSIRGALSIIKGAKKTFDAPASMEHTLKEFPAGPTSGMYDEQNRLMTNFGVPLENVVVEIDIPGEGPQVHFTDQDGDTPRFSAKTPILQKLR